MEDVMGSRDFTSNSKKASGVPSLFDMAKRVAIRNVHMIDDIGDIPYDFMRPILIRIQNPEQLHQLEENCPQVTESSGEIWERLIESNFQDGKKLVPDDIAFDGPPPPKGWYHLYQKVKRRADRILQADEDALRAAFSALKSDKAAHSTTFSNTVLEKSKRRRGAAADDSKAALRGQPKGRATIIQAKQAARENHSRRMQSLKAPPASATRGAPVVKAPNSMLADYKRASMYPELRESKETMRAPGRNAVESSLHAREARLRKLTSGPSSASAGDPASGGAAGPSTSATSESASRMRAPTKLVPKSAPASALARPIPERASLDHSKTYRATLNTKREKPSPVPSPSPAQPKLTAKSGSSTPSSTASPKKASSPNPPAKTTQPPAPTGSSSKAGGSAGMVGVKRKRPAANVFMPQKKR